MYILIGLPYKYTVDRRLPAKAGDLGSIPGPGGFPHAVAQLNPGAKTTETRGARARAPQQKKSPQREAHILQLDTARESPSKSTKTQHRQI